MMGLVDDSARVVIVSFREGVMTAEAFKDRGEALEELLKQQVQSTISWKFSGVRERLEAQGRPICREEADKHLGGFIENLGDGFSEQVEDAAREYLDNYFEHQISLPDEKVTERTQIEEAPKDHPSEELINREAAILGQSLARREDKDPYKEKKDQIDEILGVHFFGALVSEQEAKKTGNKGRLLRLPNGVLVLTWHPEGRIVWSPTREVDSTIMMLQEWAKGFPGPSVRQLVVEFNDANRWIHKRSTILVPAEIKKHFPEDRPYHPSEISHRMVKILDLEKKGAGKTLVDRLKKEKMARREKKG
jgi:hypothetical protein